MGDDIYLSCIYVIIEIFMICGLIRLFEWCFDDDL